MSPEGTVLAYDERMLLHRDESARGSPHPERPDRIRAVMARLERAGLTGVICLFCSCSPLSPQICCQLRQVPCTRTLLSITSRSWDLSHLQAPYSGHFPLLYP